MRKTLMYGAVAVALVAAPANAQNLTGFLGGSNLEPLAQGPLVLDLEAQSATHTPQADVNAYNQFFLINGPGKLVVQFNNALQNLGQVKIPGWIGVKSYSNHEIWFDLQYGFEQVKAHWNMPNAKAAHVVVYKTINTDQLVYDYAIPVSGLSVCQEFLFTPFTFGFQVGLRTTCYWTLAQFRRPVRSSAGRN
jgi:hypothetical protein